MQLLLMIRLDTWFQDLKTLKQFFSSLSYYYFLDLKMFLWKLGAWFSVSFAASQIQKAKKNVENLSITCQGSMK